MNIGNILAAIAGIFGGGTINKDGLKDLAFQLIAGRGMETICNHIADSADAKVVEYRKAVAAALKVDDASAVFKTLAKVAKTITP